MPGARIIHIAEDPTVAEGGHALLRLSGVGSLPDAPEIFIRRMSPREGLGPSGWQATASALSPRHVEPAGHGGATLRFGPEVVDHIDGPESVEIEIPALDLRQVVAWPAIASSAAAGLGDVVGAGRAPARPADVTAPDIADDEAQPRAPEELATEETDDRSELERLIDDAGIDEGEEADAGGRSRSWLWGLLIGLLLLIGAAALYLWLTDRFDEALCAVDLATCEVPADDEPDGDGAPPDGNPPDGNAPGETLPGEASDEPAAAPDEGTGPDNEPSPPAGNAPEDEPDGIAETTCEALTPVERWAVCEVDRLADTARVLERATALGDEGRIGEAAALLSELRRRGSYTAIYLQGQRLDPRQTGDWTPLVEVAERYWRAWQEGDLPQAERALAGLCAAAADRMAVDAALNTLMRGYCQGL